jgi:hypothetical protein
MQIYYVYDELRNLGVVRSTTEFSERWLGRERSYMTVLKAKQRAPSCSVWANCAVNLLRAADTAGKDRLVKTKRTSRVFRSLASQCLDQVLNEGVRGKEVTHDHHHN